MAAKVSAVHFQRSVLHLKGDLLGSKDRRCSFSQRTHRGKHSLGSHVHFHPIPGGYSRATEEVWVAVATA